MPEIQISDVRLAALRAAALEARPMAHVPYSGFLVLAAVESHFGVFGGANVENVNFSLTKHAEEVAILRAQMAGAGQASRTWLQTLYVTGASPCGSCRQFAAEFGTSETVIIIDRASQVAVKGSTLTSLGRGQLEQWQLGKLLPAVFSAELTPRENPSGSD